MATTPPSPFLETLQSAHANGLAVRVTEHITDCLFPYTLAHPAKAIDHIEEVGMCGTAVVFTDGTEVVASQITSVTVEQPPATPYNTTAPGLTATGKPYTIACGAGIALRSAGGPFPDDWRADTDDLITGFGAGEY